MGLCHSTWCPQTGNRGQNDHNPHLRHNSEQTGLSLSMERKGGRRKSSTWNVEHWWSGESGSFCDRKGMSIDGARGLTLRIGLERHDARRLLAGIWDGCKWEQTHLSPTLTFPFIENLTNQLTFPKKNQLPSYSLLLPRRRRHITTSVDDNHQVNDAIPPRHLPTDPHHRHCSSPLSCSARSSPNVEFDDLRRSTTAPTSPSPLPSLRDVGAGAVTPPPTIPHPTDDDDKRSSPIGHLVSDHV